MLAQKRGEQAVEEGQKQSSYLESVLVRIGTDDYLRPAKHIYIKRGDVSLDLAVYLDSAADNAKKIGNYLALEYLVVAALHTVERLSAHGDDRLVLGVSSELTGRERGISLNYIKLADRGVLRATVNELFNSVGDVERTRQLLLDRKSRVLGILAASLVDEHLICEYLGQRWGSQRSISQDFSLRSRSSPRR